MQLLVIFLRLEAERIEVGVQMAAHAVGADHHQRAHRIAGRATDLVLADRRGRRRLDRLGAQLLGDRLLGRRPVAVERVDQVALRRLRPVRLAPGRAFRRLVDARRIVAERGEEVAPAGLDRERVLLVFRLKRLDVGAVRAVQERGLQQRLVDVLAGHGQDSLTCRAKGRRATCRVGPARATRGCRPLPSRRSCLRRRPCRRR